MQRVLKMPLQARKRKRTIRSKRVGRGVFCCKDGSRKGEPASQVRRKVCHQRYESPAAKIALDVNALKARVVEVKHGLDVKLAEKNAELLESDAGFAIDYAIASVEQARLAVLDAIDGRLAAEQAKRS